MSRRVAVIGPGRVGTAIALSLARGGDRIVAAVDAGGGSAASLGGLVAGCRVLDDALAAVALADHVLLTVPDDHIEDVVADVARRDGFTEAHHVVHCSGAKGLAPLRPAALAGARVAACHPAQTVPAGADAETLVGAAWAVTADPADRRWATELVVATGGDAHELPEAARTLYHAALVLGSNAVGAAVAVARQLLLAARVEDPARFLGPLVEASVGNVLADGASALTGPVVRGDVGTVGDHLAALTDDLPRLEQAYRALQQVVLDQARTGIDEQARASIAALLADGRQDAPWTG